MERFVPIFSDQCGSVPVGHIDTAPGEVVREQLRAKLTGRGGPPFFLSSEWTMRYLEGLAEIDQRSDSKTVVAHGAWSCRYCGGMRAPQLLACSGCGAPRSAQGIGSQSFGPSSNR